MKKEFLPYYISRGILSAAFAALIAGLSWKAAFLAAALFGLFLLYLHSGWFQVDLKTPFTPLRRDLHGKLIQRNALILSVAAAVISYFIPLLFSAYFGGWTISGHAALSIGILVYFCVQFVSFMKT